MGDPFFVGMCGLKILSGIFQGFFKDQEGKSAAKADEYRASLADENAQRAELVWMEKEFRARNEGILDAGLFRMQAAQSGLSGVSKDLWVGQRYMDVHRDVEKARASRSQTVSRFLKEAGWHRDNAAAAKKSGSWSAFGTVLSTGADLVKEFHEKTRRADLVKAFHEKTGRGRLGKGIS